MSKSREQLNDYLKKIDLTNKVVLDIGVQNKPTKLLTKGNPEAYYTTDIDIQWSPDFLFDLNKEVSLLDTYQRVLFEEDLDPPTQFDIIFCIEVLEHCYDPIQALKNIFTWLKPEGVAYISTPFINPHHDYWDFLRFTDEFYQKALSEVGFNKIEVYERKATVGKQLLSNFFQVEGLRYSKVQQEKRGDYSYPIGYFVKAIK